MPACFATGFARIEAWGASGSQVFVTFIFSCAFHGPGFGYDILANAARGAVVGSHFPCTGKCRPHLKAHEHAALGTRLGRT